MPYVMFGGLLPALALSWTLPEGATKTPGGQTVVRMFAFLIVATALETFGDAVVRLGLGQGAWLPRGGLFVAGALLLFGYGLSVNLAPVEFSRVVGLYIAILFIMWQIVNLIVFRNPPGVPVILGGALIIAGGAVVTFWK